MRWPWRRKQAPLTRDLCEKCGKPLRADDRVEVFESADMVFGEYGLGGGGIAAVYCRSDAP